MKKAKYLVHGVLKTFALCVSKLAGQEGFEPPTRRFGVCCSTIGATGLQITLFLYENSAFYIWSSIS